MSENTHPFQNAPAQIKVLDLGTQIAGPFVATMLGDLGAEVIKVEQPGLGDTLRMPDGMSSKWQAEGRNKRSITLNLRVPEGQDILKRLAGWADVLVENFRPGTMEKWGVGYDQLSAVNPGLVYVAISGFGRGGPYSQMSGYDYAASAMGGATAVTGYPDRPPTVPGAYFADYTTGLFGALGAVEAVRRRDAPGGSGKGAFIDMALYESVMRFMGWDLAEYALSGTMRDRAGGMPRTDGAPEMTIWYSYRTRDGRFVAISPVTMGQITDLRAIIKDPDLDERFETLQGRMANGPALYEIISRWTEAHDFAQVWDTLSRSSVPAAPVNAVNDLVREPHILERGSLVTSRNAQGQELVLPGPTPRISGDPREPRWTGEPLGASNRHVFANILGLSPGEVADLESRGVI